MCIITVSAEGIVCNCEISELVCRSDFEMSGWQTTQNYGLSISLLLSRLDAQAVSGKAHCECTVQTVVYVRVMQPTFTPTFYVIRLFMWSINLSINTLNNACLPLKFFFCSSFIYEVTTLNNCSYNGKMRAGLLRGRWCCNVCCFHWKDTHTLNGIVGLAN